jgi:succinate dehydrogenase/fumarate reductase flavoprotein subunit
MAEQRTYDVVVVGGGIAGLAAANRAAELGLKVALLERGTRRAVPVQLPIFGRRAARRFPERQGRSGHQLLEAIQSATRGRADPESGAGASAETSGRAVDWLTGLKAPSTSA